MNNFHRIALAGNPNVGKSTIFNALTGGHQHVGNWPGKTVSRREGWFEYKGERFQVIDLPGIYSLSPYSPDEEVARDYIVKARPDLVVNVVDATNLERNLYLTVQILETETPLLIMLNMLDLATQREYAIDYDKLSRLLGAPVLPAVASRGEGLSELQEAIWEMTRAVEPNHLVPELVYAHGDHSALCVHCN